MWQPFATGLPTGGRDLPLWIPCRGTVCGATIDVVFTPPPFHDSRPGLVAPVGIDPRGEEGPTRGQARGPHWRTTSRGLFVPAHVDPTPEQRALEGSAVLRAGEAVTGWAALRWLGGSWFTGTLGGIDHGDVTVLAKRHLVAQSGFRVCQEFLPPGEILIVDGLAVTQALRSVTYEMRYAPSLGDAVVALDMACYSDLVTVAEVAAYVAGSGPVTGIKQARDAVAEAEENSWSPQETRMRGVWTRRAGLARPKCNVPVFTLDGRHVGTPDLIGPELGLVGQYHGSAHLSLASAATDIKKDAAFRDLGLETVSMVASDWADLDGFVARIHSAARRARARSAVPGWTLTPPAWWTSTETVAQRRSLSESQRRRYLRYRLAA